MISRMSASSTRTGWCTSIGFPPIKQPVALEAAALAFGCPRKMGQKKRHFHVLLCPTYMLSGIASAEVCPPTFPTLEHGLSCAGHSRSEDLRRRRRRAQVVAEGVARDGLLGESCPSAYPRECRRLRHLHYFRIARHPGGILNGGPKGQSVSANSELSSTAFLRMNSPVC